MNATCWMHFIHPFLSKLKYDLKIVCFKFYTLWDGQSSKHNFKPLCTILQVEIRLGNVFFEFCPPPVSFENILGAGQTNKFIRF